MVYDDIIEKPPSKENITSDTACKYVIVIITMLMLILGLPSILSTTYDDSLPGILALGLAALILSILYLGTIIEKAK